jgi:hypothetical protein
MMKNMLYRPLLRIRVGGRQEAAILNTCRIVRKFLQIDSEHLSYYILLRPSEGTLSRWSRLNLQSLAPTNPH